MQPWSFKSIPKDARISREGMRVYYMNQQQEVLTFCPKAISSWGQHPPFHKNLGLAEGLAEMVTTLSGLFVRTYFRTEFLQTDHFFLSSMSHSDGIVEILPDIPQYLQFMTLCFWSP